jgi:hypothetical protein
MTTIIWDGKHLYSDSQVTGDEMKSTMAKAVRVNSPDGPVAVAVAGEVHILRNVIAAIKAGDPVEPLVTGSSSVLIVKGGECKVISGKKSWPEEAPVFIGSGSAIAKGAYHVSKSVAKAMAAACAIDLYSCGPIVKIKT